MATQISAANAPVSIAPLFAKPLALLQAAKMAKRKFQHSDLSPTEQQDARRLKELIDKAKRKSGENLMHLAATVGVSSSAVSQWQNGDRPIPIERIAALAAALGVEQHDISPTLAKKVAALGSPSEPAPANVVVEFPYGPDGPARYTIDGMQITTEQIEVGIEWGRLDEPTRTYWRGLLMTALNEQTNRQRVAPNSRPSPKGREDKNH